MSYDLADVSSECSLRREMRCKVYVCLACLSMRDSHMNPSPKVLYLISWLQWSTSDFLLATPMRPDMNVYQSLESNDGVYVRVLSLNLFLCLYMRRQSDTPRCENDSQ